MTTIDVAEKCKKLDIEYSVFSSASEKLFMKLADIGNDEEPYRHFPEFLSNEEIIAIVRYQNLHKRAPEYFDWDKGYIGE